MAARNGGLRRGHPHYRFVGGGREFNEAVLRRLEDRGLIVWNCETGVARASEFGSRLELK